MDRSYIAGFFDGEGSALVITIRRQKGKISYQLRPTIQIAQKTTQVLHKIKDHLGYGKVVSGKRCAKYIINNKQDCLRFIQDVAPYVFIKKDQLILLKKICLVMKTGGNLPYKEEEFIHLLGLRDKIFNYNQITRSNLTQKYPLETILKEHNFINQKELIEQRRQKGTQALNRYSQTIKLPRKKIFCACECGGVLVNRDNKGRTRKYILGHHLKNKHWVWRKNAKD